MNVDADIERHGKVSALRMALPAPRCEFVYVQAEGPGGVPEVDIVDASRQ